MPIRRSAFSTSTSIWAIRSNGGDFNLETARKGNLGAEFFSIWVEPGRLQGPVRAADAGTDRRSEAAGGEAPRPDGTGDFARRGLSRRIAEHKIAALMGIEGGHSIEDRWDCCGSTTRWACAT